MAAVNTNARPPSNIKGAKGAKGVGDPTVIVSRTKYEGIEPAFVGEDAFNGYISKISEELENEDTLLCPDLNSRFVNTFLRNKAKIIVALEAAVDNKIIGVAAIDAGEYDGPPIWEMGVLCGSSDFKVRLIDMVKKLCISNKIQLLLCETDPHYVSFYESQGFTMNEEEVEDERFVGMELLFQYDATGTVTEPVAPPASAPRNVAENFRRIRGNIESGYELISTSHYAHTSKGIDAAFIGRDVFDKYIRAIRDELELEDTTLCQGLSTPDVLENIKLAKMLVVAKKIKDTRILGLASLRVAKLFVVVREWAIDILCGFGENLDMIARLLDRIKSLCITNSVKKLTYVTAPEHMEFFYKQGFIPKYNAKGYTLPMEYVPDAKAASDFASRPGETNVRTGIAAIAGGYRLSVASSIAYEGIPSADTGDAFVDVYTSAINAELDRGDTTLCNGVGHDYLQSHMDDATIVLVVTKISDRRIIGLGIVNARDGNEWSLDVLCGTEEYRGIGSYILGHIKSLSVLNSQKLVLDSLEKFIGFYLKQGFVSRAPLEMEFNFTYSVPVDGGGSVSRGRRSRVSASRAGRSKKAHRKTYKKRH